MNSPDSAPAVADTIEKLKDSGCLRNLRGCSNSDIARLEQRYQLSLSKSYKEFLRLMGRGADGFYQGDSWRYQSLSWIRQHAEDMLAPRYDDYQLFYGFCDEDWVALPSLPKTAVPFFLVLPQVFFFFDTAEGADPAVYVFKEDSTKFERYAYNFAEWIARMTENLSKLEDKDDEESGKYLEEESEDGEPQDEDGNGTGHRSPCAQISISYSYHTQEERWAQVMHRSLLFQLEEWHIIDRKKVVGCSQKEIDQIEETFGVRLPYIYRMFLSFMGKSADTLLGDCQWHIDQLHLIRNTAQQMLVDAKADFELAPTDFVFLARGSDLFLYFNTANEDLDPPVYRYFAGSKESVLAAERFSHWLKTYESDGHNLNLKFSFVLDHDDLNAHNSAKGNFGHLTMLTMIVIVLLGVYSIPGAIGHKPAGTLVHDALTSVLGTSLLAMFGTFFFSWLESRFAPNSSRVFSNRYDERRKHGYVSTRGTLTATVHDIKLFHRGEDGEGSTTVAIWHPKSEVTVDGEYLRLRAALLYREYIGVVPRAAVAEWESELQRLCTLSSSFAPRTAQKMYRSELFGDQELTEKDPPSAYCDYTPFSSWHRRLVDFSIAVFFFPFFFAITALIVGPLFAKYWLFNWWQFPGGFFAMIPALLLGYAFLHRRFHPAKLPPVQLAVDLEEDRIWHKVRGADGSKISSVLRWRWDWQLHVRNEGVRLFSPKLHYVLLLCKGKMYPDKLAKAKEIVTSHGGTVHGKAALYS